MHEPAGADNAERLLGVMEKSTLTNSVPSIRMVIQRYRRASLLIDERHVVTVGGPSLLSAPSESLLLSPQECDPPSLADDGGAEISSKSPYVGMLVYISFSKSVDAQNVEQAAKTILNLPIQTEGSWGDGSSTRSILQILRLHHERTRSSRIGCESPTSEFAPPPSPISILLVPQANLIANIKKNGKSVQYRDQVEKDRGRALYESFVAHVEMLLLQHYGVCQAGGRAAETPPNKCSAPNNPSAPSATPDPSIPPRELFRRHGEFVGIYGTYDEATGFPLTMSNGEELTKSGRKKLQKIYDAHAKRHEKSLNNNKRNHPTKNDNIEMPLKEERGMDKSPPSSYLSNKRLDDRTVPGPKRSELDPSFVQLVAGSFGRRQGLEICSDMGPFCHVIEL